MKIVLGTLASNQHVQNVALALLEAGWLETYETGWVDANTAFPLRWLRRQRRRIDRELSRRQVDGALHPFVRKHPGWELLRTLSSRSGLNPIISDWLHDRSTFALERGCIRRLQACEQAGFFGVEYGSLEVLRAAKEMGRMRIMAFLSPHHRFRARWVDVEYEKYPELVTATTQRLRQLAKERDQRRDEEAALCNVIHTGSRVTAQSLIDAGIPSSKIYVAPLGISRVSGAAELPERHRRTLRILYVGSVSVHKGAHYLLEAWRLVAPPDNVELHFYGAVNIPARLVKRVPNNVFFHGSVPRCELDKIYAAGFLLAFPTLCDGFGMVIGEALAQGLPVITTANAGASTLIDQGKNGFLVPPADSSALAAQLEWCIAHPDEVHAMRGAALQTAAMQKWSAFRATIREQLGQGFAIDGLAASRE